MDKNLTAPCGNFCPGCEYYKTKCGGCGSTKGKPFWIAQMKVKVCPLYDCCINKKQLEHCGWCDVFPCDLFLKIYDPAKGQWRVFYRAGQLVYRKKIGTKKWIKKQIQKEKNERDRRKKNSR